MPFYSSGAASSSSSSSSGGSSLFSSIELPVGSQGIALNDLVSLTASGKVKPTSAALAIEGVALTNGIGTITSETDIPYLDGLVAASIDGSGGSGGLKRACTLTGGRRVLASLGDSNADVGFVLCEADGSVVTKVKVSSSTGARYPVVAALSGGGFAFAYRVQSSSPFETYVAVYDSNGTQVVAPFDAVNTDIIYGSGTYFYLQASKSDNYFCVAWVDDADSDRLKAKIYNGDDGSTVKTEFNVFAGTSHIYRNWVHACTNGDFVFWGSPGSATTQTVVRYTNAGTIVGSEQNIGTSTQTTVHAPSTSMVPVAEFSTGEIAALGHVSSYWDAYVINAAFTTASSALDLGTSLGATADACLFALSNGYVYVSNRTGNNGIIDTTPAFVVDNKATNTNSISAAGSYTMCEAKHIIGIGLVECKLGHSAGTYAGGVRIYDPATRAPLHAEVELFTGSSQFINGAFDPFIEMSDDGVIFVGGIDPATENVFTIAVVASASTGIIGVASAAAAANAASVAISTQGAFTINQATTPLTTFDHREGSPPGNKGTVMGSSVLLYGLEPSTLLQS